MQILSGPRSGRPFKITLWLIASLAAAAFVHAEPGGERFGNSEVEALGELHETPLLVSRDGDGHEYRGGEIVVIADPEDLPKLAALKAPILEKRKLNGLGGVMVRIGVPLSIDPIKLREKISEVLKNSAVDVNGVYRASGLQYDLGAAVASSAGKSTGGLVGVVDTTIDTGVAELSRSVVDSKSFVNGAAPNRNHGTAVAYLAAIHGARLLGANVFARDRDGRDAASLEAMTRAVDWLALKGAVTINLSLEGPPNAVLRDVVRRAQSRGITLVAAAGNSGPAAPPAYPAAYPGVVAVTAVDANNHVYILANRGGYVMFAARGVGVSTPASGRGWATVSGTSYAAPVVAAIIARRISRPDPNRAAEVLAELRREARSQTPGVRDAAIGFGVLTP